jgi:hypothetical protein
MDQWINESINCQRVGTPPTTSVLACRLAERLYTSSSIHYGTDTVKPAMGMGREGRARCHTNGRRAVLFLGLALFLPWPPAAKGQGNAHDRIRGEDVSYQLRVTVSLSPPQIDGVVHVRFENRSSRTLEEAIFVLFPQRFATPDPGVDDFNRRFIYPYLDFDPGWIEILDVRDDGRAAVWEPIRRPPAPDGTLLRARIARLPPGKVRTLTLRFRTTVPLRFGSFGHYGRQLTLAGGWYPFLVRLDADGTWRTDEPPPPADFDVHLRVPAGLEVVVNGRHFGRGHPVISTSVSEAHHVSLIAAPEFIRDELEVDGTQLVLLRRPRRWTHRVSLEPPPDEILRATLRTTLEQRPAVLSESPQQLVVVEAPLRLNLTADGEGALIISDRMLRTHWLLRPFHELQLAQGVYAEMLRPRLIGREPNRDYVWVQEGLARELARRLIAQQYPQARTVYDWIELFNIFALVDRFESEPQVPFVSAFFERARVADPLRGEVMTANDERPPGRVILGKLRDLAGDAQADAVLDRCVEDPRPFRDCAAQVLERDLDEFFTQWLQPFPQLNYSLEQVALNRGSGARYRHTAILRREASREVFEPVTVRMRTLWGRPADVRWDGMGNEGKVSIETDAPVWQAVIDPDRRLIEERKDDNAAPIAPQVVLDSAEVEVSSTEFGLSALVVGRNRYDYRKDLAAAGFYTNRSIGFTAGGRWHGGAAIDVTRYRHNAYLFYGFQGLDGDFTEKGRRDRRTPGQLGSLGLRYDYTNVFAFDNPTGARTLRLFADWFDEGLGSDYEYVDWGVIAGATQPLGSYRTIAAGQILNGFSRPLRGSLVPNQGLYSLGGSRSIRGIGAEEDLARNILLVRAELRRDVTPELDLNLLDFLVLRQTQLRLFADAGRVHNAAGRVYDVGAFAVGVGLGFGAVYEFMGFFPSLAYVEVATRVDESDALDDVQFLFGTRQAF